MQSELVEWRFYLFLEILIGMKEPSIYIINKGNEDLMAIDMGLEKWYNAKGILDEIRIKTSKKSRRRIKEMKIY